MSNLALKFEDNSVRTRRSRKASDSHTVGPVAAPTADPVLSAIAEWRTLKAATEPLRAAIEHAEEQFSNEEERLFPGVTFLGITVHTVEEWAATFGGGKVSFRGPIGDDGLKLLAALVEQVRERNEAWRRCDMEGKEDALTEALGELWAVEPRIMALTPTTAAGARELLEFVAYWLDDNRDYSLAELRDEGADFDPGAAIQRALAVLAASGREGKRHA